MDRLVAALWHCRRGEWHRGLAHLRAVPRGAEDPEPPGLYWSYLGHALARCEDRYEDGLRLCELGVRLEGWRGETYWNLAWTRLLSGDRLGAFEAMTVGLEVEPSHPGLRRFHDLLGVRQPPVIRFLSRANALNVCLGRWRAQRPSVA